MKKTVILILCLIITLAAAACGDSKSPETAPPDSAPETSPAATPITAPASTPDTVAPVSQSPVASPVSTPPPSPSPTLSSAPSPSPSPTPSPSPASTPAATASPAPEISAKPPAEPEKSVFENAGGVLTTVDLENAPFDGCGLKIEIKHGSGGYVKFTKTGLDGSVTVDYFTFMPSQMLMEKHYYVSAMGMDYYYTYDLDARELLKIENGNREDSSESTKNAGRWDSASATVGAEAEMLESYFSEQFGASIYGAYRDESFGS